MALGSRIFL